MAGPRPLQNLKEINQEKGSKEKSSCYAFQSSKEENNECEESGKKGKEESQKVAIILEKPSHRGMNEIKLIPAEES